MQVIRTERGWPGHFICGDRCVFHRNTLLQYEDVNIVVSTVGAMKTYDRILQEMQWDTVGSNRYYETMVFHAEFDGTYWDADAERPIYACPLNWSINDINFYTDKEANYMHERIVEWYAERLGKGCKFEIERDEYGADITDWSKQC